MRARFAGDGIPLFRIAGIPVFLAYSWFLIALYTVVAVGPLVSNAYPELGPWAYAIAFTYAVMLLLSVLIHEFAHAFSAKAFGWSTEKIVLNLWGGHTQFNDFTATPGKSVIVAMVGPVANFVLAGAGWLLQAVAAPTGVTGTLLNIFIAVNFVIGLFNVLPGLPLDGGRLVESLVWRITKSQDKGTIAAGWVGRLIAAAVVVWFLLLPFLRGENLQFAFSIITVLVAGFLWMGASESIKVARMRLRLPGITAAQFARPARGIPAASSAADAAAVVSSGLAVVIQGPTGVPEALLDPAALASVPPHLLSTTPVTAVCTPLEPGAWVPENANGRELVDYLSQLESTVYAVVNGAGTVTGVLSQGDIVAGITGRIPARP